MKAIFSICSIALCVLACPPSLAEEEREDLIEPLRPYVQQIVAELDQVSAERKEKLDQLSAEIATRLKYRDAAYLTFICTHNSRRSYMSHVRHWTERV